MRNKLYPLLAALLLSVLMPAKAQDIQQNNLFPRVKFVTEHGEMVVELDRMRAPLTVDNFLRYVVAGDYNNTLFHRVVEDFVVQGGGYKADDSPVRTRDTVVNESGNGLTNQFATIAMARERNPHSASSQFYFNVKDNDSLNPSSRRWGYAVFGRVVENDALLYELASVETHTDPDTQADDVPVQPLRLIRVQLLPRE
ncbi:MAG: peptidylprolyl isomerase [Idiomarina sp.]|nr:peptidylprolyl isomerase [Idiomarina sp.]